MKYTTEMICGGGAEHNGESGGVYIQVEKRNWREKKKIVLLVLLDSVRLLLLSSGVGTRNVPGMFF